MNNLSNTSCGQLAPLFPWFIFKKINLSFSCCIELSQYFDMTNCIYFGDGNEIVDELIFHQFMFENYRLLA